MSWKKIDASKITGIQIAGDPKAPPTRWWNHWWLALFGWKTTVILGVPRDTVEKGYRVGYKPAEGPARLKSEVQYDYHFAVRLGREDCTFFVIDVDGEEVQLSEPAYSTTTDVEAFGLTLH